MSKPENVVQPDLPAHGAAVLPSVTIDSYNVEIEDEEGFIGDKASKSAFWELVDKWRSRSKEAGEDPLGDKPSEELSKRKLADLLSKGDPKPPAWSKAQSRISHSNWRQSFVAFCG